MALCKEEKNYNTLKTKRKIKSSGRDRGLFFPYNSHIDAQLLKSNEVKVGTFLFVVAKSINKQLTKNVDKLF